MAQMKKVIKTSEKELNKMETSKLLNAEFKTLVIGMLNELRGRADGLRANFNSIKKDMDTCKNAGYIN